MPNVSKGGRPLAGVGSPKEIDKSGMIDFRSHKQEPERRPELR